MKRLLFLLSWALLTGILLLLNIDGPTAVAVSLAATLVTAILTSLLFGLILIVRDIARAALCERNRDP
ncbi:MAG: hypothetical protein PHI49_10130 [Halothiobacillaceae bacterium]|nr:hypothetical protein [Halothiobacillaceae bacterium]